MLLRLLLLVTLVTWSQGTSMSSVVQLACQREPTLSFCHNVTGSTSGDDRKIEEKKDGSEGRTKELARVHASHTLSEEDRKHLEDIAAAVARATREKRNPFSAFEDGGGEKAKTHEDADLRETEATEGTEGFVEEESSHGALREKHLDSSAEDTEDNSGFKGSKDTYCENYEQHFSFYCVGEHDSDEESIAKFCPSYKRACPNKKVTSAVAQTSWPADPFGSSTSKSSARLSSASVDSTSSESSEETSRERYNEQLLKRFPCKPDCDKRIFPHCTEQCKCDYAYPHVQKFCNPPPMPLFLNTCRLWYAGCPQYDRYHYSSQFVYSKAEKGKVLPGPSDPNPLGIPTGPQGPIGRQAKGLPTQLSQSTPLRPLALSSKTLYIPPDLPKDPAKKDSVVAASPRPDEKAEEVLDAFELTRSHHHRRKKSHRRHHGHHHRRHRSERSERVHHERRVQTTTEHTPTKREVYQKLKALSALTSNPAGFVHSIVSPNKDSEKVIEEAKHGKDQQRPRANAAVPVVPSDAAFGADPFKAFDGYTDSRGILHRPTSTSPFTKPGLWEPNPADPHSRDPANKYWYHPESVGVDWLNGQLQWGAHWAVPAVGTGGTDGQSTLHFPSIGNFLNIPDDYD